MSTDPTTIKAYYQDFSLMVGERDWREPNGRHERLRMELDALLGGARGLRILDVGCGAGVMSSYLCRYGSVTGLDFSAPAIALAQALEPRAAFRAGSLDVLEPGARFDLITMFDVLEHVPDPGRPELFAALRRVLDPGGWLVLSTPHPEFTRRLHEESPELLQVVDDPVDVVRLLELADGIGLEPARYITYDVDVIGARQYQFVVLAPPAGARSELYVPALGHTFRAKLLSAANPVGRWLRPWQGALRLARRGRLRGARWLLGHDVARPG